MAEGDRLVSDRLFQLPFSIDFLWMGMDGNGWDLS
jgi:hypothetical protein